MVWHVGEDLLLTFTASTATAITAWTIALTIYDQQGGAIVLGPIVAVHTDEVNGVFTVTLTSANTTLATTNGRWFQVRRTDSWHNTVLAEGKLVITP